MQLPNWRLAIFRLWPWLAMAPALYRGPGPLASILKQAEGQGKRHFFTVEVEPGATYSPAAPAERAARRDLLRQGQVTGPELLVRGHGARAVIVARVEIDVAFSEAALRAADARPYSTKARIPKIVFSRFGSCSPVARSNVSLETVDTHWGRSCASCDTRNLPDASGSLKVFKYSGSFALIRCRAAADRAVAVRRTVCCTEP